MFYRTGKSSRRVNKGRSASALSAAAECAEQRLLLTAGAIDGTGNNLLHPEWGSTNEALLRLAASEYADGISAVAGEGRPGARQISNEVSDSGGEDTISNRLMSAMVYAWGQFIDHDLTLTKSGETENMSIPVPAGDASFDPLGTGNKTIDTMRSGFDASTGTSTSNPREQVNLVTAFMDGSMVYGSDAATAASLRTFSRGLMKTSSGNLLPVDDDGMFLAGDIRSNENPGLVALQTLFVREHNYQAAKFAASSPTLTDEQIYQKARSIVAAEIQAITYNEWLPSLLGRGVIDRYEGYDAAVNPGISNEFATAAFRFGHSLLGDNVEFMDNNGLPIRDGVALSEAFFRPDLTQQNGIDSVLKYLSSDPSSEVDTEVVDGVRNFLFGPPGAGGLDLASLNIQRGRDHGLADYNSVRESIGLRRVTSFAQITSDKGLQEELKALYGNVDNIDLWVGGLAENHTPGGSVGITFRTIIADQFQRLRDGDSSWYQKSFSGKQLAQLQQTSLSDIIERNTSLTSIQQNAFFFKAAIAGTVNADVNRDGKVGRGEPAMPRVRLQLVDTADGSVVATTTTDNMGHYDFDIRDGLRTGIYQVRALKSDGTTLVTSGKVAITGGDDFERISLAAPAPPVKQPTRPSGQTPAGQTPAGQTPAPQTGTKPGPSNAQTPPAIQTPPATKTPSASTGQPTTKPTVQPMAQSAGRKPAAVKSAAPKPAESLTRTAATSAPSKASVAPQTLQQPQLHTLLDSLYSDLPSDLF